jgi:purine-binding chemotaxis protein CheW
MTFNTPLVVFSLNHQRCALALAAVERVVRVVEITPLPNAPEVVLGVVNVRGRLLPVIDVRRRLGLPPREHLLSEQLILARLRARSVLLLVDSVAGLETVSAGQIVADTTILPSLPYLAGVAKLPDGLIVIHNLDQFLSLDEERALAAALAPA